jgi:hypothetical protein
MSLKEQLRSDLTAAMKAKDDDQSKVRMATLRMALSAISTEEVSGAQARVLSDDEVIVVLAREAKKRRESADAYESAGRPELAATELAELAVLQTYLPEQLSNADLAAIVDAAVAEAAAAGSTGMRAMGAVMKIVQPQVRGRADGTAVADLVKARLSAS